MGSVGFWARNLLWPKRTLSKFGRLLGALSIFTILKEGFDYRVSETFARISEYYDRLVTTLIGWASPYLEGISTGLGEVFSAQPTLTLYPHWKHIFILLGIYFFRNAANNTQHERLASRVFKQALSGLFALVFSAATGLISLDAQDMSAQFQIAAIPILGAWLYDIVYLAWHATFLRKAYANEFNFQEQKEQSWTAFFVTRSRNASIRYVIGLLLAVGLLQIPQVQALPGAGLFVLAVLVILLGFYWMGRGMSIRRRMILEGRAPETLPALPSINLSSEMLGVFAYLLIILLINAGLIAYGL